MSVAPMPQSPLTAAQRSLVESALPSVKRYVRWLTPRFHPHPFDELFQIASEAVSRTAHRHDPARGPFVTYCFGRVLGEIIDYAEADRRRRASLRAMRRTLSEVSEVFSDPGDPFTEPAEARLERFAELRDAMGAALALGLLSPTTPEDAYLAEEERRRADTLAQAALEVLGPEHRSTAVAYFFQGRSLEGRRLADGAPGGAIPKHLEAAAEAQHAARLLADLQQVLHVRERLLAARQERERDVGARRLEQIAERLGERAPVGCAEEAGKEREARADVDERGQQRRRRDADRAQVPVAQLELEDRVVPEAEIQASKRRGRSESVVGHQGCLLGPCASTWRLPGVNSAPEGTDSQRGHSQPTRALRR